MSIELNDLTPLVPTQSVESIYEPHFDAKLLEIDFSNVNFPFNLVNFDGIFITNCPNLQAISNDLTKRFFVRFFNRQTSTFILKIDIADFESINPSEIQQFMEKFDKKIFLISIENSSNEKVQFFWKFQDEKVFWIQTEKEISKFVVNFLASSMRIDGHCGLSADFLSSFQSSENILKVDKLMLRNLNGLNLLMIAAEYGDSNVVNFCLKTGFNVNETVNERKAVDLAWNNQHFEIVLDLLKANSQFPVDIEVSLATKEIKEFLERKQHKQFKISGFDDKNQSSKGCCKYQIKIFIALFIAIPLIVWFGIRLKIPDIDPLYSCGNLTDDLRSKVLESTVDFQGVNVIFGDLFGRNSSSCEHLSPQEVTRMLKVFDSGKFVDNYTGIYENFTAEENDSDVNSQIYIKYNKTKFREPALKIDQKVNIRSKFYINRYITYPDPYNSTQSPKHLTFNDITKMKLLLLSDKGGSGKSTYFRHMAWKLKRRFPLKWISYVDLKQHVHVLQDVPKTDANLTTLVDFLSSKILNLTSKVEIEIFGAKFLSNDSIFLWDGVDEVSPMYTDEILRLVEIVGRLTENKQWMAARPHLDDVLQSKFNINVCKFEKLNNLNKEEFMEKFWDFKNLKMQNMSKMVQELDKFSNNLQENINPENKKLDLSENLQYFYANCEAYVKNLSLIDRSVNLYEVFDIYVQRTFKESLIDEYSMKITENKNKNLKKFQNIHQHFAVTSKLIINIFNIYTAESDISCKKLEICRPLQEVNDLNILKFGLIYKKDDKMVFEYSIFKDFFLAQYFITNIWNQQSDNSSIFETNQRLPFLFHIINESQGLFKIVADFIVGYITAYPKGSTSAFSEPSKHLMLTIYSDLLAVLGDIYPKIDMATKLFKKDIDIINVLWKINRNRTFFHEFFEKTTLADDVAQMTKIVDENFNQEDRKKILEGRHQAANFLRISWQKRANKNSTIAFMNAVNFHNEIENLRKIKNFEKFMEFLESEYFSKEELREFFMASLGTRAIKTDNDVDIFIKYAKKLLSKDEYAELSINWEPYEV